MNVTLLPFVAIDLALLVGAALLLIPVVFGRGRVLTNLVLGAILVALAIGVWLTAIRSPL